MRPGLLAVLFFLLPSLTFAASDDHVRVVKRDEPEDVIYDGSSEYFRLHQKYQLTAQLFGLTVSPVSSTGLNAALFLDRNSLLQIEASKGSTDWFFYHVESTVLGLHYKHFVGNSFYVNAGVDDRKIRLSNMNLLGLTTAGDLGASESITGSFQIGNQWQWQNFTLGCDWVGWMQPVAVLSKNYDTTGLSSSDKSDLDKAWDEVANAGNLILLRFYLGFSF